MVIEAEVRNKYLNLYPMFSEITIKNARLVNSHHPLNQKLVGIRIENGVIQKISEDIAVAGEVIDASGAYVSAGWVDPFSFIPDPGAEWKESLETASIAFNSAGFTASAVLAGLDPMPEKPGDIQSIINRSVDYPVKMMPFGLATENRKGMEMAEAHAMHSVGAVGVTDGIVPHAQDGLRVRMLEYCHSLNIPYFIHPYNTHLVEGGLIHEGSVSVDLGMKGIPTAAETSALLSDIELAKWLKVPLRVLGISSKASLEVVKEAKRQGLDIQCAVPVLNLLSNEEVLKDFNEVYKVLPPLRTKEDKNALIDGILDGSIDAIFSNHTPEDVETQKVEFEYAHVGADTLSGFASMISGIFNEDDLPKALNVLSTGNRQFLGLEPITVTEGSEANLTIFDAHGDSHPAKSGSIAYNRVLTSDVVRGSIIATIQSSKIHRVNS